ncbi:NAD-dependent succinate-semialdehyde dehydrogenase [Pullulanibacillus camelliae]|uniref:Aldehyde dehydrogenase n=1 Tax=Pullulanibacillus camelliae TaxID=1707096 RepID=A0A8J2VK95_9BACL|nr:NAD-dependent succinate-semialdehyde dehydrogenase [Pullulanibacillus camelliae]GGE27758.1 NAD-dependent succinate-semialdehyde dehydrogenase [Pullulanibacillus camelliae]
MINEKMFVNGSWVESCSQKRDEVKNPATDEKIGTIPSANREDASKAIEAANQAFRLWSKMTAYERSNIMYKAYEQLLIKKDEIAAIMTLEQGKPLSEAKNEVKMAAEYLKWYAEEAKRVYGDTLPSSHQNKRLMVIRQPIGVVAAITPWNFPASMITRKIAPALAAGCTVVVKPSELTPFTAVEIFKVLHKAGFPNGTINLVTGEGAIIGKEFLENQVVRKIAFTGSTRVGKYLYQNASEQVKKLSLELGGHAPFIVFADSDIDQAVNSFIISKYRNAGQTCICANRLYVEESIKEAFITNLVQKVKEMKTGDGFDEDIDIGPLIDKKAYEKVHSQVKDAVNKGGIILTGGHRYHVKGKKGYFYEPTIIENVDNTMDIYYEETFGPVAPIITFASEEEVIQKANDSLYGLAAYVFTKDLGRSYRMLEELEYGIIGINDPIPGVVQAPFGGWKESGIGREGGYYGMDSFLETKYASIDIY